MRWLVPLVVLIGACTAPLGTDDSELVFHTSAGDFPAVAAIDAHLRLESARINAEVTADGVDTIRVRVESSYTLEVRRLLAWTGELDVLRYDPGHPLAPATTTDLVAANGCLTGPADALELAAIDTADATDRLVFSAGGEPRACSALLAPVVRTRPGLAGIDGKTVVVEVDADAAAAALAHDADTEVVLVVASLSMWHGKLRDILFESSTAGHRATLVIPRGDDLLGYLRARRTVALLDAPPSVPPAFVSERELPADWSLAIACMLIPIATGLVWLVFVRRFDPARAEPWWLVLATFAFGCLAQRVVGVIELAVWHASEYLDHRALSMDHRAAAFPLSFLACVLVVGIVEEGAKLLATTLARRRREFDEPIDGIVYASAAAVGFAAAENIMYFTDYRMSDGITVGRTLLAMPGHVIWSALWGYAIGQRLLRRHRLRGLGWFLLAAAVHALWDTALDFHWLTVYHVLLATQPFMFVVLVRRALRWGVVERSGSAGPRSAAAGQRGDPSDDPAATSASGARASYRVGQPIALVVAIAAMCAIGWALIGLAEDADLAGEPLTWLLLAKGSALGVMFAVAAFVMARVMPLDVVVDDRGVTFAGALHRWAGLRGATRAQPWLVVLHGEAGDVRLGPGSRATLDKLEAALSARLSR
nr:PrsW family intramembrane metalloprotease [Kofleriaceae bacterium]